MMSFIYIRVGQTILTNLIPAYSVTQVFERTVRNFGKIIVGCIEAWEHRLMLAYTWKQFINDSLASQVS